MSNPPASADCAACPLAPPAGAAVDRRTFLSQATLAAVATALAACSTACSSASDTTAPTSIDGTVRVSDYPALASVGGIVAVTVNGNPVAIVRTAASTYVTLSRVCPHQQAIVNVSGAGFLCPQHGAQFSATGTWVGGQPTGSLRSYPSTYDASTGILTIG